MAQRQQLDLVEILGGKRLVERGGGFRHRNVDRFGLFYTMQYKYAAAWRAGIT